ncbi:MAG: DNA repair protein RecO [Pedosphaera sp.]|nr:DNA repair protein RecO [Pedosphaera sp.]
MIEHDRGIILRSYPLRDTSLIVHWLGESFGRIATVAKAARTPKSPFRGRLDLYYLAQFTYTRSRRSELHTLREVQLIDAHQSLFTNFQLLRQIAYCSSLIEQTTEKQTPLPEAYRLFSAFLNAVSSPAKIVAPVIAFEIRWITELGFKPDLRQTRLSTESKDLLERLSKTDFSDPSDQVSSPETHRELQLFLNGFILEHLGRIPKGRSEALSL